MPISAGQRITAALLSWDMDGTTLATDTPAAVNTYEDWGTETVTFANPGVPVRVLSSLFGQLLKTVAGVNVGRIRIGISIDGGTTFDFGTPPEGSVGDTAGQRTPISAGHVVAGTPTGSIVVKAQLNGSVTTISFVTGFLQVQLIPTST